MIQQRSGKGLQLHHFLMQHSELRPQTTKEKEKAKEKPSTANNSVQFHVCKKFGHMALNCWLTKPTTYTIAAIGSGTPSQPQHFDLNHTILDQPIACMPSDQLATSNNRGQGVSGSYMQSTAAPYSRAPSTTSYISARGPGVYDITHIEDDCYRHMTTVSTTCNDINYTSTSRKHHSAL